MCENCEINRRTNLNPESRVHFVQGDTFCQMEKGSEGRFIWHRFVRHLAYLVGGEDHCGGLLMSLVGSYKAVRQGRQIGSYCEGLVC